MKFALEVAILECSFPKHSQQILGIKNYTSWSNKISAFQNYM
jgi:hypothetical protein